MREREVGRGSERGGRERQREGGGLWMERKHTKAVKQGGRMRKRAEKQRI